MRTVAVLTLAMLLPCALSAQGAAFTIEEGPYLMK
jgi:hypothetical protein